MRDRLGASIITQDRCQFRVWAPNARKVELELDQRALFEPMTPEGDGYFTLTANGVRSGTAYRFRLDGERLRPDPASRLQSDGVHGPSRVVDLAYDWRDAGWRGVPLSHYVVYELHVGTFSAQGTFAGVVPELARLKALGVTAIEIMPVAQFPGARNWGYDGVFPFAVQHSYGGPQGLQQLVDECHRAGLAVILDVVYNHLGPEGNYLAEFGPYFTDRYKTPWGSAINFDQSDSDDVRRYFIENALQWIEDFHVDALRLDAVHAIIDHSALPFLEELASRVHQRAEELGRRAYLIAESDLNDPRVVAPSELGGLGLDSMWSDDFHHAAHVLLTGEQSGYYADFGKVEHLANAWRTGMSSPGEISPHRRRRHGRPAQLRPQQCVVCIQNHDQVGNRLLGERSSALIGFEQQKLAAGLLCLSPFIPMLFMGEEYGETAPFLYFVSHGEPELLEAVRRGRAQEFAAFGWQKEADDPGSVDTFRRCVLNHELRSQNPHAALYALHERLLALRARLGPKAPDQATAFEAQRLLFVQRGHRAWMAFVFSANAAEVSLPVPPGRYRRVLSSTASEWQGPGDLTPELIETTGEVRLKLEPYSFVVYAPTSAEL
jgi:maltooligosyltrehalose trehalohydrolase